MALRSDSDIEAPSNTYGSVQVSERGLAILGNVLGDMNLGIKKATIHVYMQTKPDKSSSWSLMDSPEVLDGDTVMTDAENDLYDLGLNEEHSLSRSGTSSKHSTSYADLALSLQRAIDTEKILFKARQRSINSAPRSPRPPDFSVISEWLIKGVDAYIACSIMTCDDQGSNAHTKLCYPLNDGFNHLKVGMPRQARKAFMSAPRDLGPPSVCLLLAIFDTLAVQPHWNFAETFSNVLTFLVQLTIEQFGAHHPLRFILYLIGHCHSQRQLVSVPWRYLVDHVGDITAREPILRAHEADIQYGLFRAAGESANRSGDYGLQIQICQQRVEFCRLFYGNNSCWTNQALGMLGNAYLYSNDLEVATQILIEVRSKYCGSDTVGEGAHVFNELTRALATIKLGHVHQLRDTADEAWHYYTFAVEWMVLLDPEIGLADLISWILKLLTELAVRWKRDDELLRMRQRYAVYFALLEAENQPDDIPMHI